MNTRTRSAAIAALLLAVAGASNAADALLERGRYLVNGIVACGNCHTPQGPGGPEAGQEFAGQLIEDGPQMTVYAPNISSDPEHGIGRWTDAQIATAIREGRRPDGRVLGPPMPFGLYRSVSDADMKAIIAYLRSVPAVRATTPKSEYRFPLPPSWGPPVGRVAEIRRSDKVAWGAYLAGPLGHCIECHSTPDKNGVPDPKTALGAGGMHFDGPWGRSVAPNITPTGLARFSDAEIKKIVTTGARPDGSRLKPPMGIAYYARLSAEDLDALVAYLRSLPRK